MYKVIVYDKKGNVSKFVYFTSKQARMKQVYTDGLFRSNISFKEEFYIQL